MGFPFPNRVTSYLYGGLFLGLLLVMAAAPAVTTIGFRLAPRLRETTLQGLHFSHEVKPVLIGLAGMFVGAYLQGVLAEGRPKLQG